MPKDEGNGERYNISAGAVQSGAWIPPIRHSGVFGCCVGACAQAKIADFGLSMKKKSSGYLGTPFWMAPELLTMVSRESLERGSIEGGLHQVKQPYQSAVHPVGGRRWR